MKIPQTKRYSIYKSLVLQDKRITKLSFNKDNRNYYVYRVTDIKTNEYYYGSRITKKSDLNEDFWSYGTSGKRKNLILEHKENYKIKILKIFDNAGDMIIYESFLHQYFDVAKNNKFWNGSNQLPWGFTTAGIKRTKEVAFKTGKAMRGKKHSEETKLKISNSQKGDKNHMFGKKVSEDTIQKMKESARKRVISTITCPHCSKSGKANLMTRWHFDNCKFK